MKIKKTALSMNQKLQTTLALRYMTQSVVAMEKPTAIIVLLKMLESPIGLKAVANKYTHP